ncbi:MAG: cytochrome c [Acidobacteria bacterium]|nr:cytochrome c [Acidobacteriota bacterium]
MWSTKKSEQRAESREQVGRRRRAVFCCLLLTAYCLLSLGCRQDMQDQPKYEAYESSRTFKNGQASRPLVEGTVARGHLREDAYFYTGKASGTGAGGGAMTGTQTGGMGAAMPNTSGGAGAAGSQGGGDVNVRGNVGGGAPNAQQAAAMSGPDVFPFPVTGEVLERGRERFNIYCSVCHGQTGDGDGMIPRRGFQKPPSFHEDRLQEGQSNAGHFFDVIANGWGAMPSYGEVIAAEDRWKIIAYVRALQLSRRLNVNDLPPEAQGKVRSGAQEGPPVGPHGLEQQEQPHRGGERN